MVEYNAAVRLQGAWRGWVARSGYRIIRIQRERERLSLLNEVCRKVIQLKCARQRELQEVYMMTRTATILQCFVRRKIAEQTFSQLKSKAAQYNLEYAAAVKIQACARSYIARKIYLDILYYICRIQAHARGYLVRIRIKSLYRQYIQNDAAAHIQRTARKFLRRRERFRINQNVVQQSARVTKRHIKTDALAKNRPIQLSDQRSPQRNRVKIKQDQHVNSKQRNIRFKSAPTKAASASDRAAWVPPGASIPSAVQPGSQKVSTAMKEECKQVDTRKAMEAEIRRQRGSLIRQAMIARKNEAKRQMEATQKQQQAMEVSVVLYGLSNDQHGLCFWVDFEC